MWVFIIVQLANVFLSTIRSILTVSGSRLTAATISAISYTFGAVIVKLITQQDFYLVIIVTFLSNFIGVYLAKLFLDKTRKERLWTISATAKDDRIDVVENALKQSNIQYTLVKGENHRNLFFAYAKSKEETDICKKIFDGSAKYSATENIF